MGNLNFFNKTIEIKNMERDRTGFFYKVSDSKKRWAINKSLPVKIAIY